MATEYYGTLCDRFEKLKLAFLPEEFSPTGEYEDIVYEHTRAYKVLTHAELEYYFEEVAKANVATRRGKESGRRNIGKCSSFG